MCYTDCAIGISSSTLMTFRPLLLQAPKFQQVCTDKIEAVRRQRALFMLCRQWMQRALTPSRIWMCILIFVRMFLQGSMLLIIHDLWPLHKIKTMLLFFYFSGYWSNTNEAWNRTIKRQIITSMTPIGDAINLGALPASNRLKISTKFQWIYEISHISVRSEIFLTPKFQCRFKLILK